MIDLGAFYRDEWARCVAVLTRVLGDLDLAEDAVQDAFTIAHERWPTSGAPDRPTAWIIATARNRAIDRLRRESTFRRKAELLARLEHGEVAPTGVSALTDDRLALVFTCCHPALAFEGQVALTLRAVAGLQTAEIARAFLVSEQTLAQRLVRAKRKLRETGIPFRVPSEPVLPERLPGVLRVIYLVFNEGYAATSGGTAIRHELCREATRLAKLLCVLMPDEPEPFGLLALLLLTDSRRDARLDPAGEIVLLADQDTRRWDRVAIDEGLRQLDRARRLAGDTPGGYTLQAEIAAGHAGHRSPAEVAAAYEELDRIEPSPIVRMNRAVSIALAGDVAEGLVMLDAVTGLDGYHYYAGARADLLRRLGRREEARAAYVEALATVGNDAERRFYRRRLAELTD